jgi:hypothetical protein
VKTDLWNELQVLPMLHEAVLAETTVYKIVYGRPKLPLLTRP